MKNERLARWLDVIAIGKNPCARRLGAVFFAVSLVAATVFYVVIAMGFDGAIEGHFIAITQGVGIALPSKAIKDFLHGRRIIDITRSNELRICYLGTGEAELRRRWINFAIDSVLFLIAFVVGLVACFVA